MKLFRERKSVNKSLYISNQKKKCFVGNLEEFLKLILKHQKNKKKIAFLEQNKN